jgi:hypothetical protein
LLEHLAGALCSADRILVCRRNTVSWLRSIELAADERTQQLELDLGRER